ncbi:hypothetical protein FA95DRAFT_1542301 [Auriscalpium vulgare]|uniref:Uncharacterized protein n=1 Tax=Auriscalpium vulgare TaxID=40419 RepID=A0ACB8RRJ3_9AGAM|nr:hypothetical protein FA95DRAFT_1542301 [Auriscalpium vulgare]
MEAPSKRKVTAKVDFNNIVNRPPARPLSPSKPTRAPSSVISEPVLRPKAKVNSSATVLNRKVSASSSTTTSVAKAASSSALPRPVSPYKRPISPYKPIQRHVRNVSTSRSAVDGPTSKPKAALTAHALSRQRSLTGTPADPAFMASASARQRRGSGSFHPAEFRSASPSRAHLSPDSAASSSAAVRVKAKVTTGLTRANGLSSAPSTPSNLSHPSSPPYATTRPVAHARSRAPSIPDFGAISNPPSPTTSTSPLSAYPITSGSPSANPHRYASPRIGPSPSTTRFQSFTPHDDHPEVKFRPPKFTITPKVDPASVPLPAQSPPASTLSFSSRSSRSSASQAPSSVLTGTGSTVSTLNSHVNGVAVSDKALENVPDAHAGQTIALDALVDLFDPTSRRDSSTSLGSPSWDREDEPPASKIRAEAKSHRKIEDLEITNRSLLTINASLEVTKHRQAKEIHELRRKLRESRLILPPRAYRAVKSSLPADDDDEPEEEDEEEDEDALIGKHDEVFGRVKGLLDVLLESGRAALARTSEDFREGGKVLSAEEVRSWRGGGDDASDVRSTLDPGDITLSTDMDSEAEDDDARRPLTPSRVAVPDSEDEVETMVSELRTSLLPPITVTLS